MSIQIARRQFTVAEFERMAESGILAADDRVELIEGEIVAMTPVGTRHAACVRRLDAILNRRLGQHVQVSVQNPIQIGDSSEPEPDVALLKPRDDFYAQRHPRPDDIVLLIEVAETSLDYDRDVKLPLYARAGIGEVWLIDLNARCVDVYSRPVAGRFVDRARVEGQSYFTSVILPELTMGVADMIG